MRVLIVGAGGVGSALATICARRDAFEHVVVADLDPSRAARASATAHSDRVSSTRVDASERRDIVALALATRADVIVNSCDPRFNPPIFEGAFEAGCHYLDMAMHLSSPHPTDPYNQIGRSLGAAQFAANDAWTDRGLLAVVGMGVEPGFSDVAARYASDHLFSTIHEIGVRDGSDLVIEGFAFAPTFSIWTTIEECLNPPIVYERDRGWFTTSPFSEPEQFVFPEGIGELKCVNVEHEEVLLMPRWLDVDRVTFKYGLGDEFLEVLTTLHKLGLDSTKPVTVRGTEVSPRDLVAAVLPNPAELGHRMTGRTCAGTWITGIGNDGNARSTYIYQIVDNGWTMAEFGHQAVVWQTAVHPAVALEMLATGEWKGEGVKGPEAFSADPFLPLLAEHGAPWSVEERPEREGPSRS
ncbi:MAG: saccharopine dehydrogenase C-terminal domain-containing protein [Ilumatobacteraceae bacterium]